MALMTFSSALFSGSKGGKLMTFCFEVININPFVPNAPFLCPLSPNGIGLIFIEIYPGLISDSISQKYVV